MRSATSKKRARSARPRPMRWIRTGGGAWLNAASPGRLDSGASRPNQADLAADLLEGLQRPHELLIRVRRHQGGPDQRAPRGRRRREHAVDEDALLLETMHHAERGQVFPDDDRNHGRARLPRVQAERAESIRKETGVLPKPLAALRIP